MELQRRDPKPRLLAARTTLGATSPASEWKPGRQAYKANAGGSCTVHGKVRDPEPQACRPETRGHQPGGGCTLRPDRQQTNARQTRELHGEKPRASTN